MVLLFYYIFNINNLLNLPMAWETLIDPEILFLAPSYCLNLAKEICIFHFLNYFLSFIVLQIYLSNLALYTYVPTLHSIEVIFFIFCR